MISSPSFDKFLLTQLSTPPYFTIFSNLLPSDVVSLSILTYNNESDLQEYHSLITRPRRQNQDDEEFDDLYGYDSLTPGTSSDSDLENRIDIDVENSNEHTDSKNPKDDNYNPNHITEFNSDKEELNTRLIYERALRRLKRSLLHSTKKCELLNKQIDEEAKIHQRQVDEYELDVDETTTRLNELTETYDQETRKSVSEIRILTQSVVRKESEIKSLKEEIQDTHTKVKSGEQRLEYELLLLQKELVTVNSKCSSLQLRHQSLSQKVTTTCIAFANELDEYQNTIMNLSQMQQSSKKKWSMSIDNRTNFGLELEKMKEEFRTQRKSVQEMELSYNNISRLMNNKINKINKLENEFQEKQKLEKEAQNKILNLETKLKKEKDLNIQLLVTTQSSDLTDVEYEKEQLKLKIKKRKMEAQILETERDQLLLQFKLKRPFIDKISWSDQIQIKTIADQLTSKLEKFKKKSSLIERETQLKIGDFKTNSLPNEWETMIQDYKDENSQIIDELERLESLIF
ncbi:nuclear mitotic apparatus protein [Anaeramoeba flamelloides]|uniref:Nuclear mitotic apparatus protein n=1 Tax=Anaeramoeba flamelloides TaxID=1746091 RepID=A0AAV8A470_9EUKA|nr:nuclear mitotic apparatus protein [Anaeramoeba flamelloides]